MKAAFRIGKRLYSCVPAAGIVQVLSYQCVPRCRLLSSAGFRMVSIRQSPPHSAYYKGIEDAYRKLGLRSQINTILKPALERSLQRGTHW